MKEYKVYCLVDPRNLKIRYIGITKNSLQLRLGGHISEITSDREKNTYKKYWIKSLLRINSKPFIRLLCSFDTRIEASEMESFLIKKYRVKHKLTNSIEDEGKFDKHSARELLTKKLYLYDFEGNFIKECGTLKETAKELNIYYRTISKCLMKDVKHTHKYQFSREKVDRMENLNNCSQDNWRNIEILNTETNEILSFISRKQAADFLNIKLSGSNLKDFLGKLNYYYGNKYKVKVDKNWKQSVYYNTGVIIKTSDKEYKFISKKELLKFINYSITGASSIQLNKYINNYFKNIVKIEFNKPLCEVTHIETM